MAEEHHQQQQAAENESTNQPSEVITISEHEEKEQQVKNTEISEAKKAGNQECSNNNTGYESNNDEIWSNITPQQNASLEALHQSITMSHNNESQANQSPQHQARSPSQQPAQQNSESDAKPAVGSDEWHRQRRENHKQVERRRRENINDGINEIARIVPGCEKNKGSILNRAAAYIRQLKDTEAATLEKWTLEKLLTDQAINELNRQVEVFKAELERVKLENNYLKRELESVTNGENSLLREVKKQKMEHQTSLHDELTFMLNLNNYIKTDRVIWKKIIKCTIAYELGTILILIPQVASKVGTVPYLIVLGCLFFNASGTAGNQIVEMALNVVMLLPSSIWCAIIAYICTVYNNHIESASLYSNGAGIIAALGFFIVVFVISYIRLKYPRLFIPSLQGFVIPFFTLTRGIYDTQFNVMSIVNIFYPVLLGGGIALFVNLVFWPETAAKVSEQSFGSALASIQNVLEFIEDEVLKECAVTFSDLEVSQKLRQIIKTLDSDISKMQTARKEAKYEIVISRYNPVWYKSFAETMDSLSRNLYGFSLAVEREGQVIARQKMNDELAKNNHNSNRTQLFDEQKTMRLRRNQNEKVTDEESAMKQAEFLTMATSKKLQDGTVSKIEYKLISHLQSSVQPEMKRFIHICTNVMRCIQRRLRDNGAIPSGKEIVHTCSSHTHEHDLAEAMKSLNNAKIILQNEYEERRAEPTEDHFLIYTVLFSLTQFGKKLVDLENDTDQLIKQRTTGRFPRVIFPRVNLRKWLGEANDSAKGERNAAEQVLFDQQSILRTPDEPEESDTDEELGEASRPHAQQSKNNDAVKKRLSVESDWVEQDQNQSIPLHNAPGPHRWNKWLYDINNWVKTDPFRYAVKFTVTMECLALMAWLPIPGVNELFNNNHGQWGLLSAMVVFNFTVGSTALQCLFRLLATIIGAVAGYICLLAAGRNERPYVMAILTLVFQIPMWYCLLASKYPRIGFISLLTLTVITSTGYMDINNEGLFDPVWKRTLTSIFAILAVLIIDQLLWPVWARKMLRKHLSDLLIATGIQFSKVASLVCQENTQSHRYKCVLADCQLHTKILRRQHQLACQMLGLAQMEPRITKDAFPIQVYGQILDHEQHILYWIEHLLITQAFISTEVRKKIMNPMNPYRKELAAAVHLYLFTLAGSLRTKSSLPASLPSAEIARKLLQQRQAILWHENFDELCQLTNDGEAMVDQDTINKKKAERSAENQIYWQTYAAGSIEVIVEQEIMSDLVAKLMGQHVFKAATKDWII